MGWGRDHGGLTDEMAYGFWVSLTRVMALFFLLFRFHCFSFTVHGLY
jgi:hypothetical protein